jgi:hypothetical protein
MRTGVLDRQRQLLPYIRPTRVGRFLHGRLSGEAFGLLARMSEQSGITKTAVLELAIREKAKRDKID